MAVASLTRDLSAEAGWGPQLSIYQEGLWPTRGAAPRVGKAKVFERWAQA